MNIFRGRDLTTINSFARISVMITDIRAYEFSSIVKENCLQFQLTTDTWPQN